MTENPNLEQPIQDEELTFDEAEVEAEPNATEQQETDQPKPDKLKIKYNGVEEELSLEEAIVLAQKGKNYDHLKGDYENLKNSEELKLLNELANENGLKSGKEYLAQVREKARQEKLAKRIDELETEGVPTEHARKMAELELGQPQAKEPSPFLELFKKYPETQAWDDLSKFPDEVREAVKNGENPVVAYAEHKAKQALLERDQLLAKEKAKEQTTGSLTTHATEVEPDPFLKGFLGT